MNILKLALATVVVLVLAGAAGRLVMAQSGDATPPDEAARPDFVVRLAENLGITEDNLQSAIKQTQLDILDEAVAAGRIDEDRATEIRERIESGEGIRLGFGFGPGHHGGFGFRGHHDIEGVAEFLGIEQSDVLAALEDGQTLGEIAAANGSSANALVDHLVTQLEERFNTAVENDRITQERADEMVANARARIEEMVNREPADFRRFKEGLPEDAPLSESPPEGAGLFF